MATFQDLQFDWSTLCQDCTECWTQEDLQLAAELGKTLLERNKELETSLKQHQNIIEDQTQEIEYLTKQTVALREVNDSRLRIYEQLEVSIHDLERANHRLTLEAANDKKQIKSLCATIENLELRCDDLQNTVEQLTKELELFKRKCEKVEKAEDKSENRKRKDVFELSQDKQIQCDSSVQTSPICTANPQQKSVESSTDDNMTSETDAEQLLSSLMNQLRDCNIQSAREQQRISELEEHVSTLVHENQQLQNKSMNPYILDEPKSMHEEFNTLDEVRQGQLCSRCLRNIDEASMFDTEEEDDDNLSMLDALANTSESTTYRSSVSLNIQQELNASTTQSKNLYRDLVEKYEALLAVNRNHVHKQPHQELSLHEELQVSGDFNTDEENMNSLEKQFKNSSKERKNLMQTPSDFSEAETSSSGFADETSNKSTQTDGRPGSFLCTIADGEDCKFSIYDDASPIDSRFRNRPEYRVLFKEIFTVLKKAAENKDEGEELPLLDDCTPVTSMPKVPPVTPATEDFPESDFADDQSVISDISVRSLEPTTVVENVSANCSNEAQDIKPMEKENDAEQSIVTLNDENKAPTLTPYKREPLEYLSVSVAVRKKSSSKKHKKFADRSDSPVLPLSPRISYVSGNGSSGRKRREYKPNPASENVWNGSTLQFWASNRNIASPTPSQNSQKSFRCEKGSWDFKPSTASQDLSKLKRLDLSYAEVLRNADNKKREKYAKSTIRRK